MKKRTSLIQLFSATIFAVLLFGTLSSTVRAVDIDFFQSNDILYYIPGDSTQCVVRQGLSNGGSAVSSGNGANGNKDYKGNEIITPDQMEKIKNNQPVYEKAAAETKVPWQIFAVLHIRESDLADFNPKNPGGSQGIYQDYGWDFNDGKPYTEGPVNAEEFLRQTINAGKEFKQKAEALKKADLLEKGDTDAIKDTFFSYNGRAPIYFEQAAALGFDEGKGYEGSPYVMNKADERRDPDVQGENGKWVQYVADGVIGTKAANDHGAYLMYAALAGISSTSGSCTNGGTTDSRFNGKAWEILGQNAMKVFYQIKEKWKDLIFGVGQIGPCGCGPTSLSMAVGTLANLSEEEMNPKIMADILAENGGQDFPRCGSILPNPGVPYVDILTSRYGVSFTPLGTDPAKVREAIGRGSIVLMSADGGVLAPLGGHILLIRGLTDSGNFLVADPASPNNTSKEEGFTEAEVMGSMHHGYWEIRKS